MQRTTGTRHVVPVARGDAGGLRYEFKWPQGGSMTVVAETEQSKSQSNRWTQLLLGLVAMMAISSPQYVWTLFTGPLNQKLGTTLAEIQVTFSLLIVLQTFFSPFQAYLVDRFG